MSTPGYSTLQHDIEPRIEDAALEKKLMKCWRKELDDLYLRMADVDDVIILTEEEQFLKDAYEVLGMMD